MAYGFKSGGKKKGSQNKDLKPIREKFNQLLNDYSVEQMLYDLKQMDAKDRINCIASLAEFIVPKIARTELTGVDGKEFNPPQFVIELNETKPKTN